MNRHIPPSPVSEGTNEAAGTPSLPVTTTTRPQPPPQFTYVVRMPSTSVSPVRYLRTIHCPCQKLTSIQPNTSAKGFMRDGQIQYCFYLPFSGRSGRTSTSPKGDGQATDTSISSSIISSRRMSTEDRNRKDRYKVRQITSNYFIQSDYLRISNSAT